MRLEARDISNVALFSALTAIGALFSVPLPFSRVPITLQTLFTYMAGTLLGCYLGALSQLVYIIIGISGLPIFAGGKSGFTVLLGPTGGYLVGFVVAAYVIGKMTQVKKNPSLPWLLLCMMIGTVTIYTSGIVQLMNWTKITLDKAVIVGVAPFIAGDLLKMFIAAYISRVVRKILPRLV